MKKNDRVILTITDHTTEGEGIGHADGFALFVKGAVVGDTAECVVMKLKKNYGYARLLKVITPSPDRVPAPCSAARSCGGCQLQEMNYDATLRLKTKKVTEALRRIGGFKVRQEGESEAEADSLSVNRCIGMNDPWRYRNKALVPFAVNRENRVVTGFFAAHSHTVIESEDCLLTPPEFSAIIRAVKDHVVRFHIPVYNEETHEGLLRHLLIRKGFSTGEILISLVLNGERFPHADELVTRLKTLLEPLGLTLGSLSANVNKTPGNVILSGDTRILYGKPRIEDSIGPIRFGISANSFFQVNPVTTKQLYEKALEYAGLTGRETVWDLYCGIGSISLFLAQKAKKVYGVEIVPQAIEDARENAQKNSIENAEFFTGKAEEVLPRWVETHPKETIDVIVTDPPREGCDPVTLQTMVRLAPSRIVYVSCNPATLARDLKILSENGYRIEKVQPYDQFPWTGHVETVCCLYHQKKDFISVPYEPKDTDFMQQLK